MRIRTETGNGSHQIELAGRFDAHELPAFRTAIDPLLRDGDTVDLDLAQVVFVDSSALAELVRAQKSAHACGGTLVITALSDPVRVILELTALSQVFTIRIPDAGAVS
ncbi:STAS domain-containing protein [Nakamurella deserti]|uniref:STAS domain-containing protein n=1 Tax=Nakamurella deserti TaxID=2164074 RepID=UPI000DBEA70B|nr:STAS domain-containing protein [Nakamurella deserti]